MALAERAQWAPMGERRVLSSGESSASIAPSAAFQVVEDLRDLVVCISATHRGLFHAPRFV